MESTSDPLCKTLDNQQIRFLDLTFNLKLVLLFEQDQSYTDNTFWGSETHFTCEPHAKYTLNYLKKKPFENLDKNYNKVKFPSSFYILILKK